MALTQAPLSKGSAGAVELPQPVLHRREPAVSIEHDSQRRGGAGADFDEEPVHGVGHVVEMVVEPSTPARSVALALIGRIDPAPARQMKSSDSIGIRSSGPHRRVSANDEGLR